ncbi:MAG: hypothetical protein FJX34_02445 [Alphaproteobacteria bacterium]|nr:hypothetical protein [Alphaproteobacteria bacterium]
MLLKFFKNISLKQTTNANFYIIASFCFTTVSIFSLLLLGNDYYRFRHNISYDTKIQNSHIRDTINSSLSYSKLVITQLGNKIAKKGNLDYKNIEPLLLNYHVPQIQNSYAGDFNFGWVDTNNKVRFSSDLGTVDEVVDLSDRDYIKLTQLSPGTVYLGDPVIGKLSKLRVIPVAYGVSDSSKYYGTMVAGMAIESLELRIREAISDKNVLFALIAKNGELAMQSVAINNHSNRNLFNKVLEQVRKNPNQEIWSDFFYYRQLNECSSDCIDYGIITIYDQDAALANGTYPFLLYLFSSLLILAITCYLLFGIYENVLSPLKQISDFAQRITYGRRQEKLPTFEVKEINIMADALNKINREL